MQKNRVSGFRAFGTFDSRFPKPQPFFTQGLMEARPARLNPIKPLWEKG